MCTNLMRLFTRAEDLKLYALCWACFTGLVIRAVVGGFFIAADLAARCLSWSMYFCNKSPIFTFLIEIGILLSRISIRERAVVAI